MELPTAPGGRHSVVFGAHERSTPAQLDDVAVRAVRAVLCADGHVGYVMPVGGVCAYRNVRDPYKD